MPAPLKWLCFAIFPAAALVAGSVFEVPGALAPPQGRIDEPVFARWKQLGIQPASLSSDAVFLRRAYLDTIGTLPTAPVAVEAVGEQRLAGSDQPSADLGGREHCRGARPEVGSRCEPIRT